MSQCCEIYEAYKIRQRGLEEAAEDAARNEDDAMQTEKAAQGADVPQKGTAAARREETSGDRAARDDEAVRRFVERVALLFADWGFPRMAARVLFALMTTEEPGLTATELAARLEVSPAAISGAVRYLGQIGFLVREAVPGSRRDHYRLRDHTWYAGTATAVQFYDLLVAAADDVLGPLGAPDTAAGERVAEMRDFFTFLRGEVPALLEQWQASRKSAASGD
jgi:hypothetical protein